MSRNKFLKITKYLRFDEKSTRTDRAGSDKFCMIRELWDKFIENSQACYRPNQHLTVDEQLLSSKNRCSFIQYIPSKPDKFGIKFWLIVEVVTKYILNGFPYLGKDSERSSNQLFGEYVVEKLVEPYKNKGYCVTCDNYFTSLSLVENLVKIKTTLIGTIRKNKRELQSLVKSKQKLHESLFFEDKKGCALTIYQGRPEKKGILLSSFHEKVTTIPNDEKKMSKIIDSYNKKKVGVDLVNSMTKTYSVKCKTRRWPVVVFFNLVNMAAINSWVLYKQCNNTRISRRLYLIGLAQEILAQSQAQETTPKTPTTPSRKRSASNNSELTPSSSKKVKVDERKKCQIRKCNQHKSNLT
ncbi:unnamed protein product [Brachionus calyciflorus]|uniref:PiggyBac transposable element-derived protein domain-containing protein n=1 Tax=Brachionus calyciflorus TaxID=104777 RepID=A0A814MVM1_9BILA|nr:unnamed protein product [Brachionus calyciflorus]